VFENGQNVRKIMEKGLIAAVQQGFHYFLGGDGSTSNSIYNT
jgi:hypothetical protein